MACDSNEGSAKHARPTRLKVLQNRERTDLCSLLGVQTRSSVDKNLLVDDLGFTYFGKHTGGNRITYRCHYYDLIKFPAHRCRTQVQVLANCRTKVIAGYNFPHVHPNPTHESQQTKLWKAGINSGANNYHVCIDAKRYDFDSRDHNEKIGELELTYEDKYFDYKSEASQKAVREMMDIVDKFVEMPQKAPVLNSMNFDFDQVQMITSQEKSKEDFLCDARTGTGDLCSYTPADKKLKLEIEVEEVSTTQSTPNSKPNPEILVPNIFANITQEYKM